MKELPKDVQKYFDRQLEREPLYPLSAFIKWKEENEQEFADFEGIDPPKQKIPEPNWVNIKGIHE